MFKNKRFVFLHERPGAAEATEAEKEYKEKVKEEIREENLAEILKDEEMKEAPHKFHPSVLKYMEKVDEILVKLNKGGRFSLIVAPIRRDLEYNAVQTLSAKNQAKFDAERDAVIDQFMADKEHNGGFDLHTYNAAEGKPEFIRAYLQGVLGESIIYPREGWDAHFKSAIRKNFEHILARIHEKPTDLKVDSPERGDGPENENEREIARTIVNNDKRIQGYIMGLLTKAGNNVGGGEEYTAYRNYILGQLANLPKETKFENFPKENFLPYEEYFKAAGYRLDGDGRLAERENPNYLGAGKANGSVKIGLGISSGKRAEEFTEEENRRYEGFSGKMKNMVTKSFYDHQLCEAAKFYEDNSSVIKYKRYLIKEIMKKEPGDTKGILTCAEFTKREDEKAAIIMEGKSTIRAYLNDPEMKFIDKIEMIKRELTPEQMRALTTTSSGRAKVYEMYSPYEPTARGARRMEIRIVRNPNDPKDIEVVGRYNNISDESYQAYLERRRRRREKPEERMA